MSTEKSAENKTDSNTVAEDGLGPIDNSLGTLLGLAGIVNGGDVAKELLASKPGSAAAADTAAASAGDSDLEDEEDDDDDGDVFGGKAKKPLPALEVTEDVKVFLKKKTGMEPEAIFELLETNSALKESADYGEGVKQQLMTMPDDLRIAFEAYLKGEDHAQAFESAKWRPDFSKSFAANGDERIARAYAGDDVDDLVKQLQDEEIEQADFDKELKKIAKLKKDTFDLHKQQYENTLRSVSTRAKEEKLLLDNSLTEAIKFLDEKLPGYGKKADLRALMAKGPENIQSLIFNNGKFLKDAAIRIAFLLDPDAVLQKVTAAAEKRGATKANIKIVTAAAKEVPIPKGEKMEQKELPDAVVKMIGLQKKQVY